MSVSFDQVIGVVIPEGDVVKIQERSGKRRVLWDNRSKYSVPPKILPNQVFDFSIGNIINQNKIVETENVSSFPEDFPEEYIPSISEINWTWDDPTGGLYISQISKNLCINGYKSSFTSTGTFRVMVRVVTPYGSDEEYITINVSYASGAAKPSIVARQAVYTAVGEAMPRYAVLYNTAMPLSFTNYNYTFFSPSTPRPDGVALDTYNGVIYSNPTKWNNNQYIANGSPGNCCPDSMTIRIIYPRDANNPLSSDSDYVTTGVEIYVYKSFDTLSFEAINKTCKLVVCGIPEALLKVNGNATLKFLWIPDSQPFISAAGIGYYAYNVPSDKLTLTGSSNLTISGRNVTVNSAGECRITATTPRTFSSSGTVSTTINWNVRL